MTQKEPRTFGIHVPSESDGAWLWTKSLQPSTKVERILFVSLLLVFLGILTWGWFYDTSHPVSGLGWADQTCYYDAAKRLASFEYPRGHETSYQFGYPVLGAIAALFYEAHPFFPVSVFLFSGTFLFSYFFLRRYFGPILAMLCLVAMFYWDFIGRTNDTLFDVFVIPWNNQVGIFIASFFCFAFTKEGPQRLWHWIVLAFAAGFAMSAREEHALFFIPLLGAAFLYYRPHKHYAVYMALALVVGYSPHFVIKLLTPSLSFFESGRTDSYEYILGHYFNWEYFKRNVMSVLIDSSWSEYSAKEVRRRALLEANPLLMLSPLGIVLLAYARKYRELMLMGFALLVMVFYLAGGNMHPLKLKYHCLRYPSLAYPLLFFSAFYCIATAGDALERLVRRMRSSGRPA